MSGGNPRPAIDAALVRGLIAAQFPQWAHLSVRFLVDGGWDNLPRSVNRTG